MPTPHIHAKEINAWADGYDIQKMQMGEWHDDPDPTFDKCCGYRVKPAAPKWPQTTIPEDKMWSLHKNFPTPCDMWKFANGVIEHECRTGALVPADKVREIEAKARAEGIASALDPVDVINEAWRYFGCAPASPEDIQVIMRRADK